MTEKTTTESDVIIKVGAWEVRRQKPRRQRHQRKDRQWLDLAVLILVVLVTWLVAPGVIRVILDVVGK